MIPNLWARLNENEGGIFFLGRWLRPSLPAVMDGLRGGQYGWRWVKWMW